MSSPKRHLFVEEGVCWCALLARHKDPFSFPQNDVPYPRFFVRGCAVGARYGVVPTIKAPKTQEITTPLTPRDVVNRFPIMFTSNHVGILLLDGLHHVNLSDKDKSH